MPGSIFPSCPPLIYTPKHLPKRAMCAIARFSKYEFTGLRKEEKLRPPFPLPPPPYTPPTPKHPPLLRIHRFRSSHRCDGNVPSPCGPGGA